MANFAITVSMKEINLRLNKVGKRERVTKPADW